MRLAFCSVPTPSIHLSVQTETCCHGIMRSETCHAVSFTNTSSLTVVTACRDCFVRALTSRTESKGIGHLSSRQVPSATAEASPTAVCSEVGATSAEPTRLVDMGLAYDLLWQERSDGTWKVGKAGWRMRATCGQTSAQQLDKSRCLI